MYSVKIRKHIMIAHSLPHPGFGPAQQLHGATYVVDATFSSEQLTEMNIVIDIDKASVIVEELLKPLQYKNLDELPQFSNKLTTTEFLAAYIHGQVSTACSSFFDGALKIKLGESHIAWASYENKVK
jgi:6-pyruvoyl-tetrahydropterin synthase